MSDVIELVREKIETLPQDTVRQLRQADPAGNGDPIAGLVEAFAEEELAEEMVSYRKNVTGVDNTVFISPKGRTQHGPRIKVAINPPDSVNPHTETAVVTLDGSVVVGQIEADLLRQVREFLAINREAVLAYWNYEIDTDQLRQRLRRA